jgi:hypothetical protein
MALIVIYNQSKTVEYQGFQNILYCYKMFILYSETTGFIEFSSSANLLMI